MSSVKRNATHLPLRTEFVWCLESGLPKKLPEFHTDMEKPLHINPYTQTLQTLPESCFC